MSVTKTIPVNCKIPEEIFPMLKDYRAIANHLLSYGLHFKVDGERSLRNQCKEWFNDHYRGKYAVHYLDSASGFAYRHIESWRSNGGDTTSLPHIEREVALLNNDLYRIESTRNELVVRITLGPRRFVYLPIKVNHRHFSEWKAYRHGTLLIVPDGLRLTFTKETEIESCSESAAVDLNFDRAIVARSDGLLKEVRIGELMKIQENHRRKRTSVQRTLIHNPEKARRINAKQRGREHHRVVDLLHKRIHGTNNDFLKFVGERTLGFEDLSKCTSEVLTLGNGKRFNSRMSSWIHGAFREIATNHHQPTKSYYTRGTSRFCPFDNSKLSHPTWKQSRCITCDRTYDRDWLEALSGLVRLNSKHMKGAPWATVAEVFPALEEDFRQRLSCAPYSVPKPAPNSAESPIRGLPQTLSESVRPECAVLSPELPSVTDAFQTMGVVQENRYEAAIWVQKSGDDAKRIAEQRGYLPDDLAQSRTGGTTTRWAE